MLTCSMHWEKFGRTAQTCYSMTQVVPSVYVCGNMFQTTNSEYTTSAKFLFSFCGFSLHCMDLQWGTRFVCLWARVLTNSDSFSCWTWEIILGEISVHEWCLFLFRIVFTKFSLFFTGSMARKLEHSNCRFRFQFWITPAYMCEICC